MKIEVRWVPGLENKVACSSGGTLARMQKTGKLKKILTRYVDIDGRTYCSAYLVAMTWLPGSGTRVAFKDRNPQNWHPDNLEWRVFVREVKERHRARSNRKLFASPGNYLQVAGLPHLWVKADGTLWRMTSSGDLKQVSGSLNANIVRVAVNSNRASKSNTKIVALKELVADVWLGNRPTIFHRVRPIDGDPWNTHPNNLEWYLPTNGRPSKHVFKALGSAPKDPTPEGKRREIKTLVDRQWIALEQMGGKPLKGYPALWAMPSGQILILDNATATTHYRQPDPTGTVRACGLTIKARDFIADAFATTRYAPNLRHPRNATQTARCIDGDTTNLHPSNLAWTPCTGKPHDVYQFEANSYDTDTE